MKKFPRFFKSIHPIDSSSIDDLSKQLERDLLSDDDDETEKTSEKEELKNDELKNDELPNTDELPSVEDEPKKEESKTELPSTDELPSTNKKKTKTSKKEPEKKEKGQTKIISEEENKLRRMTLVELKKLCKEKSLKNYSKLKKDEIIELLTNH